MPEPTPDGDAADRPNAAGDAPTTGGGTPTWTVGDLADRIGAALHDAFPSEVWVRGEIHDLMRARSGHVYFSLVDDGDGDDRSRAQLSVILASANRQRVNRLLLRAGGRVRMTDGTDVRIRGRLDFYGPRGQLQLRMTSIDPAFTLGQLAAARAELLARLADEGLVERNRSVPFPALPLRIGLVTSAGSAAEADVVDELVASGYAFDIRVADVRVQGGEAPTSVAGAITYFAGREVDVVIVARGGGAATDLAAFDTEIVARAIAASPHPVLVGVGHETDRTVADEVAHLAAKTPTAAAQHLVAHVASAHQRAETAYLGIASAADRRLRAATAHLDRLRARTATAATSATRAELARIEHAGGRLGRSATGLIERHDARLAADARRLRTAGRRALDDAGGRLDLLGARVAVADPARALARGWSITRLDDGTVVRSASEIGPGTTLRTTLADGTVTSVVSAAGGDEPHPARPEDA